MRESHESLSLPPWLLSGPGASWFPIPSLPQTWIAPSQTQPMGAIPLEMQRQPTPLLNHPQKSHKYLPSDTCTTPQLECSAHFPAFIPTENQLVSWYLGVADGMGRAKTNTTFEGLDSSRFLTPIFNVIQYWVPPSLSGFVFDPISGVFQNLQQGNDHHRFRAPP
jgi:hypothetical protein